MTNLERRAILGDAEAQQECTEKGIALPCPFCGSIYTQVRHMGWSEPAQAFEAGYRGECTVCHTVSEAHRTEQEALAGWNTRHFPPIGRCGECRHLSLGKNDSDEWCFCKLWGKGVDSNDFCSCFEQKGGK